MKLTLYVAKHRINFVYCNKTAGTHKILTKKITTWMKITPPY